MGWLSSIGDAISDAADSVSDAAEGAYDRVTSGAVGDAIGWAGNAVDTATFGLASDVMDATDDYVFDTVDYVTGGAVNVDFDDGQFSVGAGFDGLAQVGASVGEAGITANGEMIVGGGFDVGLTDDGFSATGSAGIDWGPLPYAEGHVKLGPDGEVTVNGRAQGFFPTQAGLVTGSVSAGFDNTGEGWRGYLDSEGTLYTPTGVTFHAGEHLAYEQTDDGSHLEVGVEGSVAYAGYGKVGGSVDYERVEQDGDVVQGVHVEGRAEGYGMELSAEADYVHADIGGVERSDWSGDVGFDGPDASDVIGLARQVVASETGGAGDVLAAEDVLGTAADVVPMDDFDAAIESADSVEADLGGLMQDFS